MEIKITAVNKIAAYGGKTDVIKSIDYVVTEGDESVIGFASFVLPEAFENFVPFSEVTDDLMKKWVTENVSFPQIQKSE